MAKKCARQTDKKRLENIILALLLRPAYRRQSIRRRNEWQDGDKARKLYILQGRVESPVEDFQRNDKDTVNGMEEIRSVLQSVPHLLPHMCVSVCPGINGNTLKPTSAGAIRRRTKELLLFLISSSLGRRRSGEDFFAGAAVRKDYSNHCATYVHLCY